MAPQIKQEIPDIILSAQLEQLTILSTQAFVDVNITDEHGVAILAQRYYTLDGEVTIHDLSQLFEDYLRTNEKGFANYILEATDSDGSVSIELHILYCDRFTFGVDAETFLKDNFLTTLPSRRIPPKCDVRLYLLATDEESLTYSITFDYRINGSDTIFHGSLTLNEDNVAPQSDTYYIDVPADIIPTFIRNQADGQIKTLEIVGFTVNCGDRSTTFYVDKALANAHKFRFHNAFNIPEFAYLRAVTKAKTEVERTLATINGISLFYDQTATKSYEAETEALTYEEAQWIDQLLTSYQAEIYVQGSIMPILITDMTCEISDFDEKPNSIKFTWRFASNRPVQQLSVSPNIFTSPYNQVFS